MVVLGQADAGGKRKERKEGRVRLKGRWKVFSEMEEEEDGREEEDEETGISRVRGRVIFGFELRRWSSERLGSSESGMVM